MNSYYNTRMKILADATLPHLDTYFPHPFEVTVYHSLHDIATQLHGHDILLCRSTLKIHPTMLANTAIRCVATASSGTDHIAMSALTSQQATLFSAKGCNAHAVADYVIASLAWLDRHHQCPGKKIGIIGVGAVGQCVAQRLLQQKFDIYYCDPLKAPYDTTRQYHGIEALINCDILLIHANLHDEAPYATRHLLNESFLSQLKPHTVIINAARGGIVDEQALLSLPFPLTYCTDVFANEPQINPAIVDYATLCTPHIAGHSIEAKERAIAFLSEQLHRHYHLPSPQWHRLQIHAPHRGESSFETMLLHYNPWHETQQLKNAPCYKEAFLALRRSHVRRETHLRQS